MTRPQPTPLTLGNILGDLRLLLILFIGFRLLTLIVYQPLIIGGIERGVSAGGDFAYYFQLGALSDRGLLPFRDWWSEFPPIPSLLNTLIYQLAGRGSNYGAFAMLYGVVMLIFDAGNLMRVRQIGTRLYGANTGMALAWVYALCIAPAVFIWWNFEPLVAFFLLSALHALLAGQHGRSAIWAGVGALIKFTPALVLGAAVRFRDRRRAAQYVGIVVGLFGAVYAVLFIYNAPMTLPSLTAQFNKPSYQTVWALIDGNYRTGNFGPAEARLDPASARIADGQPAVIPGWVRLGAALIVGLVVFMRVRRYDERGMVYFTTLTLIVFFLQAQGWSPQWLAQIAPLVLLCFPTRDGVLTLVLLAGVTFAEYPFLFVRTGDTGGTISGALVSPFVMLVLARMAILVGICIALYRRLRQEAVIVS